VTNILLTPDEAAKILRISKRSLYEFTRARTETPIPVVRIGSQLRFRSIDIDAWVEARAKESVQ
jgi:excisionase family DNA binding protein